MRLFPFGDIIAVGEGVSDLQVGQPVVAYTMGGSYAEVVLAQADLTYPLLAGLAY